MDILELSITRVRLWKVQAPFDVPADIPGAAPQYRYTLGFERGTAGCLESQVTEQNLAMAALASLLKPSQHCSR